VVEANAPEVLATMLPEGSVSELWVFFPDPWHKSRHHKRRLIQPEFAELAARALKKGGLWRIATDWSNYAVHVRDVLADSTDFENLHTGERRGPESPLTTCGSRAWNQWWEEHPSGKAVHRSVPNTPGPTRVWMRPAAGRRASRAGSGPASRRRPTRPGG
jgi:tRNA G46 methylase TrmB